MSFSLKQNENDARERLRAFWAGSSLGRPALAVTALKPDADLAAVNAPVQRSLAHDYDPNWHADQATLKLDNTLFLAEAMPSALLDWGKQLVTVAVLAGGDYAYQDENAWIRPMSDIWERPLPQFDPTGENCQAMERCLVKVAQTVKGRGFVNPMIMERLRKEDEQVLIDLEKRCGTQLTFVSDINLHIEDFRIAHSQTGEVFYEDKE